MASFDTLRRRAKYTGSRKAKRAMARLDARGEPLRTPVPIEDFGHDHWSTFGYLETRIVDYGGVVDKHHLRCIHKRHPHRAHAGGDATRYPTRLRGGATLANHDDWDCLDDFEAAGLVDNAGTGMHPVFQLTDLGREVAGKLRAHKGQGGQWRDFVWPAHAARADDATTRGACDG